MTKKTKKEKVYYEDAVLYVAQNSIYNSTLQESLEKYAKTISSVGYIGFLTLWTQLWDTIHDVYLLISGLLILVSCSIFVFVEVFGLEKQFNSITNRRKLINKLSQAISHKNEEMMLEAVDEIKVHNENAKEGIVQKTMRSLSIITGMLSVLAFVVSICFYLKPQVQTIIQSFVH